MRSLHCGWQLHRLLTAWCKAKEIAQLTLQWLQQGLLYTQGSTQLKSQRDSSADMQNYFSVQTLLYSTLPTILGSLVFLNSNYLLLHTGKLLSVVWFFILCTASWKLPLGSKLGQVMLTSFFPFPVLLYLFSYILAGFVGKAIPIAVILSWSKEELKKKIMLLNLLSYGF